MARCQTQQLTMTFRGQDEAILFLYKGFGESPRSNDDLYNSFATCFQFISHPHLFSLFGFAFELDCSNPLRLHPKSPPLFFFHKSCVFSDVQTPPFVRLSFPSSTLFFFPSPYILLLYLINRFLPSTFTPTPE